MFSLHVTQINGFMSLLEHEIKLYFLVHPHGIPPTELIRINQFSKIRGHKSEE